MQTYLFENTRDTRLYFDEQTQDWNRMPIYWERNVPEIQQMLLQLDEVLPLWGNVDEQLLVLRECNYNVQDAIVFAEINFRDIVDTDGAAAEEAKETPAPLARGKTKISKSELEPPAPMKRMSTVMERAGSARRASAFRRSTTGIAPLDSSADSTTMMSATTAMRINELEIKVWVYTQAKPMISCFSAFRER